MAGAAVLLALACAPSPTTEQPSTLGPNAACYVCHMTFLREELSRTHVDAGVRCIDCHGLSAGHANDENVGATKPDIVFPRADVNAACRQCHPHHDVTPEKLVARWHQRAQAGLLPESAPSAAVCTDCHGRHRIARPPAVDTSQSGG